MEIVEKKKFERKVAPSKAPGRVLKKKLRDMERLLANKDKLKDLPAEVTQETEKKITEIKKQIEALGPSAAQPAAPAPAPQQKKNKDGSSGLKFTEMRRAGRKISAFKKQHPNFEASEEESKALADLELDLLYIKHFPKHEEYISIYPESPLEDEDQVKTQSEIRQRIEQQLASGEIKKSVAGANSTAPAESSSKHPASNWSDEEEEGDDEERDAKKQKTE